MTIKKFFGVLYGTFFILLIALGLMSRLLNLNQEDVQRSQETRYQSHRVANELRQSVDDLTRFARTYVVTGEPRYEQHYQDIIAIREGENHAEMVNLLH